MNGTEKVVKHLEMTQAVINRLGSWNSFLVKSWSMTIIVAAMILITRQDLTKPIFCLGAYSSRPRVLDSGQIFSQARAVVSTNIRRNQSSIRYLDFEMNPTKHKNKPKCSWLSAFFSLTLVIFYIVEIAFIIGGFVIVKT